LNRIFLYRLPCKKKQRVIAPGRAITRDGLLWGEEQTHLLQKNKPASSTEEAGFKILARAPFDTTLGTALRQPGYHSHLSNGSNGDLRSLSFASTAFAAFAFIGDI
jgi:hypothetical protein